MLLKRTTPSPSLAITTLFPELAPLARRAVRLHPRRAARLHPYPAPDPGPDESKVGGTFLWPSNELWPFCLVGHVHNESGRSQEDELLRQEAEYGQAWRENFGPAIIKPAGEPHGAYVGVIQLRAADVPELGFPEGADLFQLLWCPRDHRMALPGYGPEIQIYWRQSSAISKPLHEQPTPAVFEPDYLPNTCLLIPERVQEYPALCELPTALQERIRAWEETEAHTSSQYYLGPAPGTKVGGYVEWVQFPDVVRCASCQQEMEHLLTIASWEWDGESFRRWRPLEEQPLEHGVPLQDGLDVSAEAGLMLGDAGNLYVFLCRRCPGWPTASWLQCS
ncbi:hypothetical protein KSF_100850 [Reticulibacter mediterranei]|uniref:DUF1963 domain-containing protein n=1 Tax=Reticulibacter mediterranei TaxID=2778369 RepID=A0A8J3NA57_9CHLR|nr:hypothetical protein [Reticulibacter mediterranei]GHP00038.1 hypothetical protein KSF_100850 [Reticulibacter mediterranei]